MLGSAAPGVDGARCPIARGRTIDTHAADRVPQGAATGPRSAWDGYGAPAWDEMLAPDAPRPGCAGVMDYLTRLGDELVDRQEAAELAIASMGISFTVYSEKGNIDRAWPFDVIPRVIENREWEQVSEGLVQRLRALNLFIDDLYGEARVLDEGIVPPEIVLGSPNHRPECIGVRPPGGTWAHISGSDLVRGADGVFRVLEDNLRVPSGVAYMLENRQISKRVFADAFRSLDIQPVDSYPTRLQEMLAALTPRPGDLPVIAVLTPGVFNSAYFEHAFLASQMGALLVEGSDLVVGDDDVCRVRTVGGLVRVDVIYRRVDDLFLDPEVFRSDSMLGVPGLMRAWRSGNVALANAPGAGVADDKVVYAFVPDLIRHYLSEEPTLESVPTYVCLEDDDRRYVLDHLPELVVKPANESGGSGIFIGTQATAEETAEVRAKVEAEPRNWIAQPVLELSTAPTLCDGVPAARHVDLRPFILSGERPYVTRGGLTRVALREGSLVVNSSQGGGSKDTWIINADDSGPSPAASAGQWQVQT